jgi:N-acetylneuraminate synthase
MTTFYKYLAENQNIYIIAEIGINHNGDLGYAFKLIDIAKKCGCDAVKFQKRDLKIVYKEDFLKEKRESPWGSTQFDQKNGLEFTKKEFDEIDKYCKKINIDWFASAWDKNSLDFLDIYKLKHNKIASAMTTNLDFVDYVAKKKIHTFISTGMCSIDDIKKADEIFKKNNCDFTLLHSVSLYPCPEEKLNLINIPFLKEKFGCNVGYSGHEVSVSPSIVAATLGAVAIERHITLDRSMYGSDQSASLEEAGLSRLVNSVRKISKIMGSVKSEMIDGEEKVAKKLRYWE